MWNPQEGSCPVADYWLNTGHQQYRSWLVAEGPNFLFLLLRGFLRSVGDQCVQGHECAFRLLLTKHMLAVEPFHLAVFDILLHREFLVASAKLLLLPDLVRILGVE